MLVAVLMGFSYLHGKQSEASHRLFSAIEKKDVSLVQQLLASGSKESWGLQSIVNETSWGDHDDGFTPLMLAAKIDSVDYRNTY